MAPFAPLATPMSETVGGGTNIQSKQARVLQYKPQSKNRAKPEEPVCRSRHWAVKNNKNTT